MEVWDFSPQEEDENEDVLEGDEEDEEDEDDAGVSARPGGEETDAEMLDVESEAEVQRHTKRGVGGRLLQTHAGEESEEMTD